MLNEDLQLQAAINDCNRIRVLYASGMLDSPPETLLDYITQSICHELDVPISLITLVDADRQFFKSAQGLSEELLKTRQTPLSYSLCQYVVKEKRLVVIEDAANNPAFRHNLGVTENKVQSYLGAPLVINGQVLGSLCAADLKPRKWTESDIDFLENKADYVRLELSTRKKN